MALRSALFIDFDNVYIGLDREQPEAAERFATKPELWLQFLERSGGPERRILVRRCYMNPRPFQRFRPYLIRSAFEVVDCPSLTAQGKTSTDMLMALDIMALLHHQTHFDEFILFSGDADFTPVLLRLRKHDRRTTVLAVGPASTAYKAAADTVLDNDAFLQRGLSLDVDLETSEAVNEVLPRIARELEAQVGLTGGLQAAELPSFYKRFEEFRRSQDWLGFGGLRPMTEALLTAGTGVRLVESGTDAQAWRVELDAAVRNGAGKSVPQLDEVARFVTAQVLEADDPVHLAMLAHRLSQHFGDPVRAGGWQGAGSFKAFLERLDLGSLRISDVMPGLVYDPERHTVAETPAREILDWAEQAPELAAVARKVHDLTEVPYLPPATFDVLFDEIAREVNDKNYHLTHTSKAVRDSCNQRGFPVGRADVNFVLRGINFAGHPLGRAAEDGGGAERPEKLARTFLLNVFTLCERAQLELASEEVPLVQAWIGGELLAG